MKGNEGDNEGDKDNNEMDDNLNDTGKEDKEIGELEETAKAG